jgi:hypothetical protein
MDWLYLIIHWDIIYKNIQERFSEEFEIYEINLEMDLIDRELDEIEAELFRK